MARYRVCGSREVLGRLPGDEFNATLNPTQERRLITGGHIQRVQRKSKSGTSVSGNRQRDEE